MPELDGIQACREMREMRELKDTIIAFLSARSEEFMQIMGLEVGADDYITKPVKPRLLTSKVKALLRRYERKEDNSANILTRDLEIKPRRIYS